jgi:hypothetical protein
MLGTVFAGTPPWPLILKTGCSKFIDVPLPADPTLRKPVTDQCALILQFIREWPGSSAADVWRGLQLKKRDSAVRYLYRLTRDKYLSYTIEDHHITGLPIRCYFYIEE